MKSEEVSEKKGTSILIYGGTFDPVHLGHVAIFDLAKQEIKPNQSCVLPCFQPVHKRQSHTDTEHRINMLNLSFSKAAVDLREIESGEARYTVDTLASFDYAKRYFLVGGDSLVNFKSWRNWREILEMATLVVATRPNYGKNEFDQLDSDIKDYISLGNIQLLPSIHKQISSSEIRNNLAQHQQWLNPKVQQYIRDHKLYE